MNFPKKLVEIKVPLNGSYQSCNTGMHFLQHWLEHSSLLAGSLVLSARQSIHHYSNQHWRLVQQHVCSFQFPVFCVFTGIRSFAPRGMEHMFITRLTPS